jgi:IMP cyclohydrolase
LFNNLDDTKNSIVENKLVFQGAKNTIALYIKNDTKYSTVKYAKDEYKNALENDDYEVSSYGTKVTDQVEYVVYEIKDKEGNYYLVAYTKLTDNDTIAFIISTKDNKIDYDLLSETNKIVKTTKENKNSIQYNIKLFTKED